MLNMTYSSRVLDLTDKTEVVYFSVPGYNKHSLSVTLTPKPDHNLKLLKIKGEPPEGSTYIKPVYKELRIPMSFLIERATVTDGVLIITFHKENKETNELSIELV